MWGTAGQAQVTGAKALRWSLRGPEWEKDKMAGMRIKGKQGQGRVRFYSVRGWKPPEALGH